MSRKTLLETWPLLRPPNGDVASRIAEGRTPSALARGVSDCHEQANPNAKQCSNKDLHRCMSDQLAQAFFSHRAPLEGFFYHLIENTSLNTDSTPHTSSIIQDNRGQYNCNGKYRGKNKK